MKTQTRMLWIDAGRVLAIYLVILAHTSNSPEILSRLGVPLFVMLSGVVLLDKKESYLKLWSKRLLRLLKPWIFWVIIISVFTIFLTNAPYSSLIGFAKIYFITRWFMPVIFILYLMTPALRIFVKYAGKRDLWGVIALWYLVISVIPFYRNTVAFPIYDNNGIISLVIIFFGYYLLGYAILKSQSLSKRINLLVLILGFLTTIFLSLFHHLSLNYQAPGVVLMSAGLFGLLFNFKNYFQKLSGSIPGNLLTTVSKTSLGVYLLHPAILQFIPIYNFFLGNWISGIILFVLSFVIIFVLQNIPKMESWVT